MRKLIVTLFALIGLGATGLAFAADGPDGQGILGSPHDFTDNECFEASTYSPGDAPGSKTYGKVCDETGAGTGWNDSGQLCKVCHTPHNPTVANDIDELLWNHDDSAATGWTMYDSATMEDAAPAAPTGLALACLGCHDGIQGIDIFGGHIGSAADEIINSTGSIYPAGVGVLGSDELTYGILSGTTIDQSTNHPISVAYRQDLDVVGPTTYGGTDMWDRDETRMDSGRTIESRLEQDGTNFLVQCHSCHDVHNNSTDDQWLLRLPVIDLADGGGSEASALCLACHDK
jgi:hypothetical protein